MIFTLTVWRICLAPGQREPPPRKPLEINLNGNYDPYSGGHARSHSCPSLPITGREADCDLEDQSCCSHSGGAAVRPIAIQVSVSMTRTIDGELERGSLLSVDRDSSKVDLGHDGLALAESDAAPHKVRLEFALF